MISFALAFITVLTETLITLYQLIVFYVFSSIDVIRNEIIVVLTAPLIHVLALSIIASPLKRSLNLTYIVHVKRMIA